MLTAFSRTEGRRTDTCCAACSCSTSGPAARHQHHRTAVAIEHRQPRPKLPANSLLTGNSVATGSYSPESTGRRKEPLQIQAVASAPQLRLRDDRQSDLNKDTPPTVGKIRNVIERRVNRLSQPILRPWTCSRGNVSRRWGLPFAGAVSVGTHSDQRGSSPRKRR
jgi:hypothetical protein